LRKPVQTTLETTALIPFERVRVALAEDAGAIASAFGDEVKQALGVDQPRTPEKAAMWSEDPDYQQWAEEQRERAQQLANAGVADPARLAVEVREPP
jgi:hypothetical protein